MAKRTWPWLQRMSPLLRPSHPCPAAQTPHHHPCCNGGLFGMIGHTGCPTHCCKCAMSEVMHKLRIVVLAAVTRNVFPFTAKQSNHILFRCHTASHAARRRQHATHPVHSLAQPLSTQGQLKHPVCHKVNRRTCVPAPAAPASPPAACPCSGTIRRH